MYKTIKKIISRCDVCQKSKITNQLLRGPIISNIPERPRQMVSLDLMGPLPRGQLGVKYILALVDIFSKHIKIYAIRRATTNIILNKIKNEYIPECGHIESILTDNGTQFQNKRWQQELTKLGIKHQYTTTYHPESNPVERYSREIGRILRTYCHKKHTTWSKYLQKIEFWLNNTINSSTGYTPYEILRGQKQPLNIDKFIEFPPQPVNSSHKVIIELARRKMTKMAEYRNQYKDKGKKFIEYKPNQWILIREHKLSNAEDKEISKFFLLYRGPYRITEVNNNNTVTIVDETGLESTHNMKNVKPYTPPDPGKIPGQSTSQ
ncbi:protein NYNRIN-like [Aphis craccivora]|uniref:Protein NYNRIN-like n=1 Tax=Aphis craccivora TaxID=307492 RepID=A0A6G0VIZ2_APHCR|nr:protein NYNRIN-like [Aphis craccivora]